MEDAYHWPVEKKMYQIFQRSYMSADLCVEEVPAPMLEPGGILVQSAVSLISPGTERSLVQFAKKNPLEKIKSQPERVKLLMRGIQRYGLLETLQLAKRKLEAPVPLGYSACGVILEVGEDVDNAHIGQRVACCGAMYANHAETLYIPQNLFVPLSTNVSFEEGAFVAPGSIALHGVRLANIGLGENVVVIGLGLIGQLALQLVKAQGAQAIGIDLAPERLELAKKLGASAVISRSDPSLQETIASLTGGRGADVVIIAAATASDDPVILAGEVARDKGRVVLIGDVGLHLPRKSYYEKELSFILSRSYGPGRYDDAFEKQGQSYPAAYVRWTERDNMACFLKLVAEEQVQLKPLITHTYLLEDVSEAYQLLTSAPKRTVQPMGMLIQYPSHARLVVNEAASHAINRIVTLSPASASGVSQGGLGVVGAGNFLRSVMLPLFKRQAGTQLTGIVSHSGLTAKTLGSQYGFRYCASDIDQLLHDPETQAIYIATRHDSHAQLVCQSLAAGKHVLVEKPLATSAESLQKCIQARLDHPDQHLLVGFNRRFSPLTRKLKAHLEKTAGSSSPMSIVYRIHAGPIPKGSWIHKDGGRLVGEACHFIDWIIAMTGEYPQSVSAVSTGEEDNADITIQIHFSGNTHATVHYLMRTVSTLGKEYIEVYTPTLSATLDDFKSLSIYASNGKPVFKKQYKVAEKGHAEEIQAFMAMLRHDEPLPQRFEDAVMATATTLAILESLKRRERVPVVSLSAWLTQSQPE